MLNRKEMILEAITCHQLTYAHPVPNTTLVKLPPVSLLSVVWSAVEYPFDQ